MNTPTFGGANPFQSRTVEEGFSEAERLSRRWQPE